MKRDLTIPSVLLVACALAGSCTSQIRLPRIPRIPEIRVSTAPPQPQASRAAPVRVPGPVRSPYHERWTPILQRYRRGALAEVVQECDGIARTADADDRPLGALELAMALLAHGDLRGARDQLSSAVPAMQQMAIESTRLDGVGDLLERIVGEVKRTVVTEYGPYAGEAYERLFGSALYALTTLADPELPPSLDEAYVRNYQKIIAELGKDWEASVAEMKAFAKDDRALVTRIEGLHFTLGFLLSAIFDEDWTHDREAARRRYELAERLVDARQQAVLAAHRQRVSAPPADPQGTSPVWVVVLTPPTLRKKGVLGPVPDLVQELAKQALPGFLGELIQVQTQGPRGGGVMPQPILERSAPLAGGLRVGAADVWVDLEPVCDLTSFAKEAFELGSTGRGLRLAARAQFKGGIAALEKADDRCWTLLPGDVRLARLCVPAGQRVVEISGQQRGLQTRVEVDVPPQGKPVFVLVTMCDAQRFGKPMTNRPARGPAGAVDAATSRPSRR